MIEQERLEDALRAVRAFFPPCAPEVGIILGSGWGGCASLFARKKTVAYSSIPGLGPETVAGHAGRLSLGELAGVETLIFEGRRHYYEGLGWTPPAIPLFLMHQLGVKVAVLTAAVGAINRDLAVGDLMITADHLNLSGANPLITGAAPAWPPYRFVDLSAAYDPDIRAAAKDAAGRANVAIREGTLAILTGPNYETPAEVRLLAQHGADVAGMSLGFETLLARACGLRVLGCMCVTNWGAGLDRLTRTHDEVLQSMAAAEERIKKFFAELWAAFRHQWAERQAG